MSGTRLRTENCHRQRTSKSRLVISDYFTVYLGACAPKSQTSVMVYMVLNMVEFFIPLMWHISDNSGPPKLEGQRVCMYWPSPLHQTCPSPAPSYIYAHTSHLQDRRFINLQHNFLVKSMFGPQFV